LAHRMYQRAWQKAIWKWTTLIIMQIIQRLPRTTTSAKQQTATVGTGTATETAMVVAEETIEKGDMIDARTETEIESETDDVMSENEIGTMTATEIAKEKEIEIGTVIMTVETRSLRPSTITTDLLRRHRKLPMATGLTDHHPVWVTATVDHVDTAITEED